MPVSQSPELMQRLIESFGNEKWEYSQFYVDYEGCFPMELKSKNGRRRIEYEIYEGERGRKRVEVWLWNGNNLAFRFEQESRGGLLKSKIG